jgi:hypothetical protein
VWDGTIFRPSLTAREIEDDAMSDMSKGPGWWVASDGKWYPPHLHPSVRIPGPSVDAAGAPNDPSGSSAPVAAWAPTSEEPSRPVTTIKPGRHARTRFAVVAGVVVVILLVVGIVVVFGRTESAGAQVTKAVDSTLERGTAHISMTLAGRSDGTNLTGTGSGGIDFARNALQLQTTIGVDGQPAVPVTAIYLGGVVYESVPGLDTIAPGKSWLSIDLSALQQAQAQGPGTDGLGSNPAVMLQMLAQQGNTVVALGPSTVDGVAVLGYSVTVNPSSAEQKLKKAHLPAWMQRAVAGSKLQNIELKVFVDGAGLLRSFQMHLTETTGSSGPVSYDETIGLSAYGTPVTVTAPPADQVEGFQQLLQAAATQDTPPS